jgi:hypothetical protein
VKTELETELDIILMPMTAQIAVLKVTAAAGLVHARSGIALCAGCLERSIAKEIADAGGSRADVQWLIAADYLNPTALTAWDQVTGASEPHHVHDSKGI